LASKDVAGAIRRELTETLKRPSRALMMFRPSKVRGLFDYLVLQRNLGNKWDRQGLFRRRSYAAYDEYLSHQAQKLERIEMLDELEEYDRKYRETLRERLADLNLSGRSVLCLAARIGTEVKAFRDLGGFAAGIDVNPGVRNQYVMYGDFHNLQFADGSADFVFTNSLDHAFDIQKLVSEVRRILKPSGMFIAEAVTGTEAGKAPGFYESFCWSTVDHLVTLIEQSGLTRQARKRIAYPYEGEHLRFEKR
jgi:SAM-dependent methyltransferase